jgi:hypothetical protein
MHGEFQFHDTASFLAHLPRTRKITEKINDAGGEGS